MHEAVAALLANGADAHFEGEEAGYTPLVAAATTGRHACVRLLLETLTLTLALALTLTLTLTLSPSP